MPWDTPTTSAELTLGDTDFDFFRDSNGDVLVGTIGSKQLVEWLVNVTADGGNNDDIVIKPMTGTLLSTGTSQAGGSTSTIKLAAAETYADDELIGCFVVTDGGAWGLITDYVSSTDLATVSTAGNSGFAADPSGVTYSIYAFEKGMPRTIDMSSTLDADANPQKTGGMLGGVETIAWMAKQDGATDTHKARVRYWATT